MQIYSTNDSTLRVNLREAIFQGLPADNGLYMPLEIPKMPEAFISNLDQYSFQEIAYLLAQTLIGDEIPKDDLWKIIQNSITFSTPLVKIDSKSYILELFHGPSMAFKDFGARFMAQTMAYFNQGKSAKDLIILVATSGDTGGAVAAGFHQTPGIKVVILYPSGKVSPIQEKQLTTLENNIHALEILGTFDDCQALVKQAFLDVDLRARLRLSSANSINISRLIPQVFYYWEAYKQAYKFGIPITFIVPSGNYGNLTAGLIAQKMGLPVHHFIAATNINDVVPAYLNSGVFKTRHSIPTLSNAMDVGNPSNFVRLFDLGSSTWNIIREQISGYSITDAETESIMRQVYREHSYVLDPHGAVGYLAWKKHQKEKNGDSLGIILETAHPAKFLEDVQSILKEKIEVPDALANLQTKQKKAITLAVDYLKFKKLLLERFDSL